MGRERLRKEEPRESRMVEISCFWCGPKGVVLVHGTEVLQMLSWLRRKSYDAISEKTVTWTSTAFEHLSI